MNTTENYILPEIYKSKRTAIQVAQDLDADLTIRPVRAGHEAAGETFKDIDLASEFVRAVRFHRERLNLNQLPKEQPCPSLKTSIQPEIEQPSSSEAQL